MTMHALGRVQLHDAIHLGYSVGTGEPVLVPVQHLAVTGQTQASGKTTTLEALVARSGRKAIAFVTKRHEGSFQGEHHQLPPYFRERADWQAVSSILEATMRERMRFERSWIMRACKGATTLKDVQRNVRRLMDRSKGLSADVYMTLDHYLDVVVPQIGQLDQHAELLLLPGLNVMDLSAYTTELQALVIRSVLEWVYTYGSHVLVIIPEAWEFIPQNRGSPVLLACEQLIRKGGAGGNFVWLDSQDIAGVHKNVLRSVGVWILGVQREANEVKRALAHIPGRKPAVDDVMQLERGQFFVCFGRTVTKTYVQPAWMDGPFARAVAITGKGPEPQKREEATVTEDEAIALRADNDRLRIEVSRLESVVTALRQELKDICDTFNPPDHTWGGKMPPAAAPPPPPVYETAAPLARTIDDVDALFEAIRERALADPKLIALFQSRPEIEVTRTVERIKMDTKSQPGFLAAMIAEGYFGQPVIGTAVVNELKRRGRSVHHTNVYRDLNRLAELGFLTKEGDGYQAVPDMKINIVEA